MKKLYSLIRIEIDNLITKGISADEYGKKNAINYYKAVAYYYILINYCILIRHKFNKQSLANIDVSETRFRTCRIQ